MTAALPRRPLGRSGLHTAPIVFGGNVFGWTLDEAASFSVLDAFVDHGFDAIDTADVYSRWAPGNQGGESETIIGRWLKARPSMRERVTIFTKVGSDMGSGRRDLSARWIAQAADDSLRRLGIDHIDLYFSHWPDPTVTHEETLGAYAKLIDAGKVRAIGASNVDATLLEAALRTSRERDLPAYTVVQPEYNLIERSSFEGPLAELCRREQIGAVSYYALASGFLTGKYRSSADLAGKARARGAAKYLETPRGPAALAALDRVAAAHGAQPAEVALAWLLTREPLTAPIASATSPAQVATFAKAVALKLTPEDLAGLDGV